MSRAEMPRTYMWGIEQSGFVAAGAGIRFLARHHHLRVHMDAGRLRFSLSELAS